MTQPQPKTQPRTTDCDHCGVQFVPYPIGMYRDGPKKGRTKYSFLCKGCRMDEEN